MTHDPFLEQLTAAYETELRVTLRNDPSFADYTIEAWNVTWEDNNSANIQYYYNLSRRSPEGRDSWSLSYATPDQVRQTNESFYPYGPPPQEGYLGPTSPIMRAYIRVAGHAPAINIGDSGEPDGSSVSSFYFLLDEL